MTSLRGDQRRLSGTGPSRSAPRRCTTNSLGDKRNPPGPQTHSYDFLRRIYRPSHTCLDPEYPPLTWDPGGAYRDASLQRFVISRQLHCKGVHDRSHSCEDQSLFPVWDPVNKFTSNMTHLSRPLKRGWHTKIIYQVHCPSPSLLRSRIAHLISTTSLSSTPYLLPLIP
jgi:hypothetical protein